MKGTDVIGMLAIGGLAYYVGSKNTTTLSGGGGSSTLIKKVESSTIPVSNKTTTTKIIKAPLTKKQVTMLKHFDNQEVPTKVITSTVGHNGHHHTHTTIITSKKNVKAAESNRGISANIGTDTTIIYEDKHKHVVGGTDYKLGESLTSNEASFMKKQAKNPVFTALRSAGGWL